MCVSVCVCVCVCVCVAMDVYDEVDRRVNDSTPSQLVCLCQGQCVDQRGRRMWGSETLTLTSDA